MHFQSLFVFAAAILVGQAAAQIQTVSSKCKQVPDCTKDNVGVACKVTCEDSPGGTRVTSGLCKNGPFGFSCTP
ncbi:hypothetical protein HER10_EVM0000350 [Colletotrichum scovillei]|uniref:Uncharacterized protein n=1 Tax=Colletotrichum scovillei TaxID=1209932 RepID=A0A9P7UE32_9PEZI|nr:uncharacterized protein HER10_EVM0000350 [Colletotrichum scovillei]KAF4773438.1 hypothetical protein HER10_EVM0000350 [Colletotrichum scovillei]KAG7048472.1 hypothetical protein JMJ77_0014109 [Colletotrichum scovillei]KAG7065635.1 hypothetical protein JMJ78_0012382 [Colletotrichum scovillei]KAG7068236.1 hypothetical protein JMJ76_0007926 [Colletotrichum scovillei]